MAEPIHLPGTARRTPWESQTAWTATEPASTTRSSAPTSWISTRTAVRPAREPSTRQRALDRADPGRPDVVEHRVGRGHRPARSGRVGHLRQGRAAGRLVGQHGDGPAVQDPPGIAQPVVDPEPGDRPAHRLDAEERLGGGGPGLERGHRRDDRALEAEVHPAGVEHCRRHGGRGHHPVSGPLVEHLDPGHHRVAAPPEHRTLQPEGPGVGQPGDGGHDRGGHDPPGQDGEPAHLAAEGVDGGEQAAGAKPAAGTPQVLVDGCPRAERGGALLAVRWGDLPPFEAEVVTDRVARSGRARGPLGRTGAHRPAPLRRSAATATRLTTVVSRSPAPASRSSTTALACPGSPAPSTLASLTMGPILPRER